jgi:lysophospholipase L1-like esterase
MRRSVIFLAFIHVTLASAAEPFELKDGDRVVLLGNTLIEREQRYGYWEAALTARWPDRNITFRNLGWSGDTVHGDARAGFDNAAKGFQRLVEHTLALKPTVILIAYGGVEAFEGPAGLPRFEKGLERLLDALAPAKARIVLLSPPPPLPGPGLRVDLGEYDRHLAGYRDVLREAARKRQVWFADLYNAFRPLNQSAASASLTENGINLTETGYRLTAPLFLQALGQEAPVRANDNLRRAILAKNQEYFHRWRPQNETYLFGFRKHEQGKNAAEVLLFEPIVAKYEAEIAQIRKMIAEDKQ